MRQQYRSDLFISAILALAVTAGEPAATQLNVAQRVGSLDLEIKESSGLVKSRAKTATPFFWTHSDSGDKAHLYAVDGTGKLLHQLHVSGATNYDWEDLCCDEQCRLLVGDIGDNKRDRKFVTLYRVIEPDLKAKHNASTSKAETFEIEYPKDDTGRDAEALIWRDGKVYIFSKDHDGTRLLRAALPEKSDGKRITAERVAETTKLSVVTGAALSDEGRHLAVVNYLSISVYTLPEPLEKLESADLQKIFDAPRRVRVGWLGQIEAVAWDGADLVLSNEAGTLYRIAEAHGK